jgi:hypothetical protein
MTEDRTKLERTEALFLGQARAGLEPTAADRRRMLGRLSVGFAQLGDTALAHPEPGGGPFDSVGAGEDLPSAARLYSRKLLLGSVVGAAALGFGAGVWVGGSRVESDSRRHELSRTVVVESVVQRPASPATEAVDLDKLVAEDDRHNRPPKASARAPVSERPLESPEPALYDELSHVRRAQMALKQGNASLALGLMLSLDEAQPGGALLAERSVTKVLALCQLGRESEATKLAREVLSEGDASVYRRRLSASCAKLAPTSTED